ERVGVAEEDRAAQAQPFAEEVPHRLSVGPELGRRLDAEAAALVEGAERAGVERTALGKLKNDSHVLVRRQDADRLVDLMVADGILQGALAVKGDGAPEGDLALRRERHVQRRLAALDGVVPVLAAA